MQCSKPELIGRSVQDKDLGNGVYGIGSLAWNEKLGEFVCLADVDGRLCLVQVKVTTI